MTASAAGWSTARWRLAALAAGLALAVTVRVVLGRPDVAQSQPAALVFAGCLAGLAAAVGTRVPVTRRALGVGLAGALLVCLPVGLGSLLALRPLHPAAGFWPWAVVVTVVASAEEVFLRGSLYDGVRALAGDSWAVAVPAAAFALLHVPLYGWHALPLDLAVGLVLGLLRLDAGTPAAPAVAHVLADLAGLFLR